MVGQRLVVELGNFFAPPPPTPCPHHIPRETVIKTESTRQACEARGLGLMWILDPWDNGPNKMAVARNTDKTAKLLHLSLFSSCSHFVQQMNDSLDLLKPAKLVQHRQCTVIQGGLVAVRDLTARNAIEGQLWVRIYIFICIYFLFIFFIEFFEGVGRGGQYRWSMDRSVRWSVDPVRWTGPRIGGQCFRVTRQTAVISIFVFHSYQETR